MPREPGQEERTPLLTGADGSDRTQAHGTFDNGSTERSSIDAKTSQGPVEVSGWKLFSLLIFTWLGSFLAALDTTMTSTMSASIATSFGSLSLIGWLGSAYLIANAAVQPLSGKLTDVFGRRTGLLFSCAAFLIGNLVCGTAPTKEILILGRAVAGVGGGGLNSICTFVATDVIPSRKRGLWQGIGMLLFTTGIGLGGVVGGSINDAAGWRWAFLSLCPLTLLSAVGIYFTVPADLPHLQKVEGETLQARIRRIDFLGSFLLVSSLLTLLFALEFEHSGPKSDSGSVDTSKVVLATLIPTSTAFFALFVYNESRAKHPIIALSLMTNLNAVYVFLAAFFMSISLYILMFTVPLFLQARGASSGLTGIFLLPQAIGTATGCLGAGLIMRLTGNYIYTKPILFLISVGGVAGYATSGWQTPTWAPELYLFAEGLGMGGSLTTLFIALIASVEHEMQATATGTMYAFRTIGGTIGVAASNRLFRAVLGVGDEKMPGNGLERLPAGGCRGSNGLWNSACRKYELALNAAFLMALGSVVLMMAFGLLIKSEQLASSFSPHTERIRRSTDEDARDES